MSWKTKSTHVLVRKGQKWLTTDDAAKRIADRGFAAVAHDLGCSESTLRLVMKADGYVFTKQMIWQEPQLPGLEDNSAIEEPADPGEHEDQGRVQGGVAAGG